MITNKLSKSGLRQTFQRSKILEFLTNTNSHPTADTIYNAILKQIPTVSRTTVYNTVNTLVSEGIIKCFKTPDSPQMHFDATIKPHYHFECKECGKVYDIGICCDNVLKYDVGGHDIEDVFICYSGICKSCKDKKQAKRKKK